MKIRWNGWRGAAWTTLICLAAAVLFFALFQPVKVLPRLEAAPPYQLFDQTGQTVTHTDLTGKISLYSFLPTRHPQAQATVQSLQQLAAAVEADPSLRGQLRFVSLTLDPDFDTPQVVAEFMRQHDMSVEWRFLTGSPVGIKLVAGTGFGIYYAKPSDPARADEVVSYEPGFRLVDTTGVIRARYSGAKLPLERVLRDLALLAREENAVGADRLINEAAHLFLCFPR